MDRQLQQEYPPGFINYMYIKILSLGMTSLVLFIGDLGAV